jgi:hypothetical protein
MEGGKDRKEEENAPPQFRHCKRPQYQLRLIPVKPFPRSLDHPVVLVPMKAVRSPFSFVGGCVETANSEIVGFK